MISFTFLLSNISTPNSRHFNFILPCWNYICWGIAHAMVAKTHSYSTIIFPFFWIRAIRFLFVKACALHLIMERKTYANFNRLNENNKQAFTFINAYATYPASRSNGVPDHLARTAAWTFLGLRFWAETEPIPNTPKQIKMVTAQNTNLKRVPICSYQMKQKELWSFKGMRVQTDPPLMNQRTNVMWDFPFVRFRFFGWERRLTKKTTLCLWEWGDCFNGSIGLCMKCPRAFLVIECWSPRHSMTWCSVIAWRSEYVTWPFVIGSLLFRLRRWFCAQVRLSDRAAIEQLFSFVFLCVWKRCFIRTP